MQRVSRFKKRSSDRSGFDYKEIELIDDEGHLVGKDEFDQPPPSKLSLGGEGDISQGEMRSTTSLEIESSRLNPTFYITAAGGITPTFSHPYMRIAGSNQAVTVTANPQITRGRQNDVLTLHCVGSDITLSHGTGLNLMGSSGYLMRSGAILSLIYTTGDTAWQELSRSQGIGG